MGEFLYRAADKKGRISHGRIQALNTKDLELKLSRMGLWLIDIRSSEQHQLRSRRRIIGRKLLILFCLHMEQMLKAGASIPDAIDEIRRSLPHPRFRDVMAAITEDIRGGKGLSEAMVPYPELFPSVFSSLVRVGEKTGQLTGIFRALADNLKWEDELASRAVQAIRYPAIVGLVVMALFFFLMLFLAPRLMEFIPKMGGEIPLYTLILFEVSRIVVHWWWLMLLIPVGLVAGLGYVRRFSPELDVGLDAWLLRVWLVGPLIRKFFLVRFTTHFTLMYRAGIPVLDALAINERLTANKVLSQLIRRVHDRVAEGQAVSAALRDEAVLPPPLPRLLEAGEASGQLDGAMEHVSYFLDREVRERIDGLQAMVEPVLTLVMGGLLGWVILSVFGPIYETISHVRF
ncbi:MAG: type II secretion system F family protein [Magnetococcales bacterium]|nr:type II secretion system F family protein [Magnetococcales bacterium]MBF0148925.1 type II secretion system F family protein [Magnetococcales bacterium]